jgi:hypothetical protein
MCKKSGHLFILEDMLMEQELKTATLKFMYGTWLSTDAKVNVCISEHRLTIRMNEVEELEYSSAGEWWGSYYVFKDIPRFFILYANEKEMKFGELQLPNDVNGKHKWAAKFYRIN